MTEAELNLNIARLAYPDYVCDQDSHGWVAIKKPHPEKAVHLGGGLIIPSVNYCNNWNDLMPLVVEHGIGLHRLTSDGT